MHNSVAGFVPNILFSFSNKLTFIALSSSWTRLFRRFSRSSKRYCYSDFPFNSKKIAEMAILRVRQSYKFIVRTLLGNGFLLDFQSNPFGFSERKYGFRPKCFVWSQNVLAEKTKEEDKNEVKNNDAQDNKDTEKETNTGDKFSIIVTVVQKKWHRVQKKDPCAKKVNPCAKKWAKEKKNLFVKKNYFLWIS